jgi:hypothetical protein
MKKKKKEKKKLYTPPILRELTQGQAEKLVADRKNCSEDQAAEFLKRLRKQPPNDATDRQGRRSA